MSKPIREYFSNYMKWCPEEWTWDLAPGEENRERYMEFRARKNRDLVPFFDSIEKDALQFNRDRVEFEDIFGIRWQGKKGCHRYAGDPDYEQHLYYWDTEEDPDEEQPFVSDEYTQSDPPKGFAKLAEVGGYVFIDVDNITDIQYRFVVENHLFKDSSINIAYDGDTPEGWDYDKEARDVIRVWDIYNVAFALKEHKPALYDKLCEQVQRHFEALQKSERDEERAFAPTHEDGTFMTASEFFDRYYEYSHKD